MIELKTLISRSYPATLGIGERTVRVKEKNLLPAISNLKRGGFHVIGTSLNGRPTREIWFIRSGSL